MPRKGSQISVRIPDDLRRRLETLAEHLGPANEITRSAAHRSALRFGIEFLEKARNLERSGAANNAGQGDFL